MNNKTQKKPESKANSLLSALTNNFKYKFRIRVEIGLCGSKSPIYFARTLGIKKASEFVQYLLKTKFTNHETFMDHVRFNKYLDQVTGKSEKKD